MANARNPAAPDLTPAVLGPDRVPAVVDVLSESFHDYPVMRFVLGDEPDYDRRLHTLIRFFVLARALREETLLGIQDGGVLAAAALVSRPDGSPEPPALREVRDATWTALGDAARARYEAFGEATSRFPVTGEHLHLNMIGVRRAWQGRGLGARLLVHVHERSEGDPRSTGVSLSTELEANVTLYRRFGYQVLGSARVGPVTTWVMFRPDPDPAARG